MVSKVRVTPRFPKAKSLIHWSNPQIYPGYFSTYKSYADFPSRAFPCVELLSSAKAESLEFDKGVKISDEEVGTEVASMDELASKDGLSLEDSGLVRLWHEAKRVPIMRAGSNNDRRFLFFMRLFKAFNLAVRPPPRPHQAMS